MKFFKIFIDDNDNSLQRMRIIDKDTQYSYKENRLVLKHKNEVKMFFTYHGDAFIVYCNGEFPEVKRMKLPSKRHHKLMWLMGIPKDKRVESMDEFKRLVEESRKDGYNCWNIISNNYGLVFKNKSVFDDEEIVAVFINPEITKEEIIKMLIMSNSIRSPWGWTMSFLKHNFDITGHDFGKNLPFIFKRKVNVLETVDPR